MPRAPYALEVPNDVRHEELGVERFAGLVREAAETSFDGIDAEPAGTVR
jgi:hypothetical protein